MVFVSYIPVLLAAFLMGLAAAAPMGPVNMLAIRRGLIGVWRHTLACGIGSVSGDLILFSVLVGGHYFFSDLSNPTLQTVPAHLIAEVTDCVALTIFNPLTVLYWVGVTSNWLPFAHSVLGYSAPVWGILMAAAGLMSWFTALIIVVRFIPHRIGPTFFRLVNTVLAFILVGFAAFCGIFLSRHFLH